MFDRQIRAASSKIAPFLTFDDDPYPVVHDGRIFWIQDAYTTRRAIPTRRAAANGINYIRNSVKIVDRCLSRHGHLLSGRAGRSDRADAGEDLSDAAAAAGRDAGGSAPARALSGGHLQPAGGDVFDLSHDQSRRSSTTRKTSGTCRRSIAAAAKPCAWSRITRSCGCPAKPRRSSSRCCRSRRGGATTSRRGWWRAATAISYGQLLVFQFPKQKLVFGPSQVVARINQDQVIAPQITLWNQQGSQVIQGTLMVIPIEESLIYVRPLYLRAQNGRIPELTRVIVAYQNQIVMERTLEAGLSRIFGSGEHARSAGIGSPDTPGATGATGAAGAKGATAAAVSCRMGCAWRSTRKPPTNALSPRRRPATGRNTARRSSGSASYCTKMRQ